MLKNNINKQLKKINKPQAWVSLFTGIPTGMISQFVSGRSIPTPEELVSLRAAFQCSNEDLYPAESLAIITGVIKPCADNEKSYRGKHVLISDEIARDVDAYSKHRGISRNESARVLITIGMLRVNYVTEATDYDFFKELVNGEANHTADSADHSGG